MSFMSTIINALNHLSDWFYELYLECYSAGWPLNQLAGWFYDICLWFNDLAWGFYNFSQWVDDVAAEIADILSWSTIWSYILSYVPNLTQIRDWFYNWVTNVTSTISSWWSATQVTVKGWIDVAKAALQSQINGLNSRVASLQALIDELELDFPDVSALLDWFSNWSGEVWSMVDDWWGSTMGEVQGLINSAVANIMPMIEGWQDIRTEVVTFFQDPVEYIWERFTDWFLGPEG